MACILLFYLIHRLFASHFLQWLDAVSSEEFNTDFINPMETQHEFHVTTVADDAAADSIASKVFEEEKRRSPSGVAYAQYIKPMDKVLEDFEDAMAGNVRFSTVSATESPTARTARTEQGLRRVL